MDYYNKTLKNILRAGRIGIIACHLGEKLSIPPLQALKDFFRSVTCEKFHDHSTGLYLYSDLYIADSYLIEKKLHDTKRTACESK